MAYSEQLDRRITASVGPWGAERRKMFGGNMMCGVYKDNVILRLGETRRRMR